MLLESVEQTEKTLACWPRARRPRRPWVPATARRAVARRGECGARRTRRASQRLAVAERTDTTVTEILPTGVRAEGPFGDPLELPADAVVLVTQRISCDALYHELVCAPDALEANGISAVFRIGDCVSPRMLREVVFDGHRLAREIDSENPTVAKPHLREGAMDRAATTSYV